MAQALDRAKAYAHPDEQTHVDWNVSLPRSSPSGAADWQAAGRALFRYQPATIDEFLSDGQELPFWGGLRVIHLPGHTIGHCGFYSAKHDVLFTGDMFASYFFNVHRPPAILNSVPEHFPTSAEKILRLNPRWIVPSHYDYLDGALHRRRFAKLYRIAWPASEQI
jgi:glyoxylase-like metal-dependent hydrolase (beta-lactamase superfamily II)